MLNYVAKIAVVTCDMFNSNTRKDKDYTNEYHAAKVVAAHFRIRSMIDGVQVLTLTIGSEAYR